MDNLIVLLVVGIPLLALVFGVGSIFYDIGKFFYDQAIDAVAIMKPLSLSRKAILKKYFFYYNQLSRADQREPCSSFIRR